MGDIYARNTSLSSLQYSRGYRPSSPEEAILITADEYERRLREQSLNLQISAPYPDESGAVTYTPELLARLHIPHSGPAARALKYLNSYNLAVRQVKQSKTPAEHRGARRRAMVAFFKLDKYTKKLDDASYSIYLQHARHYRMQPLYGLDPSLRLDDRALFKSNRARDR